MGIETTMQLAYFLQSIYISRLENFDSKTDKPKKQPVKKNDLSDLIKQEIRKQVKSEIKKTKSKSKKRNISKK